MPKLHVTAIRIDRIVRGARRPAYARGCATLNNGRRYDFDVNFHAAAAGSRIFVWTPLGDRPMDDTTATARAIYRRLGFADIAAREAAALRAFEVERVRACRALMPPAVEDDPDAPDPQINPADQRTSP